MLINLRNALMTGKRLPYDAELEFLESTGTQWIDTGVIPDRNTKLSVTASATATTEQFMGAIDASSNRFHFSFYSAGYFRGCVGMQQTGMGSADQLVHTFTLDAPNNTVSEDGTSYSFVQKGYVPSVSIWLFGRNSNYPMYVRRIKVRICSCQIYQNGVLVRDFIPVRKGTVGYLYDRVSGRLFGNAGTGDFVLGPDVVPVEYIESHGTEWIDTGFKANTTTTRFECGIVPLNTSPIQGLCGSRNTINLADDEAANIFVFNGNLRLDWLNGYQGGAQTYAISSGSDYDVSITRGTAVINGTTLTSTNDASITENGNFLIGNFSNGTTRPFNTGFIGRWKLAKLFSNGVIVRSFRPIRVGTDATSWEGAMMDVLTRRIYRNAGTGAFTYGNDLKYPIPAE